MIKTVTKCFWKVKKLLIPFTHLGKVWDHKPGDWQVNLSSETINLSESHEYKTSNSSVNVSLKTIFFVIVLKPFSRSGAGLQTEKHLLNFM